MRALLWDDVGATLGQSETLLQRSRSVHLAQQGVEQAPILVIGDPPAVVALAGGVLERLERRLFVLVDVHLELSDGDFEVSVVKAVGDVPPDGPERATLLNEPVAEREAEAELLEHLRLVAPLEEFLVGDGFELEGAAHVSAQTARGLVGHLDSVLKDRNRESRGRHGREPEPELLVGVLRVDSLADFLQRGHPGGRQVAILEQHPLARLAPFLDEHSRLGTLTLPHGDDADVGSLARLVREL
mmetsp:Transcript_12285/g.49294  ORF Transcript_12285/g.49294 Transcript_12285/m.49294 type:complete len:243 (-) Transcript_12285:3353-4081(-)